MYKDTEFESILQKSELSNEDKLNLNQYIKYNKEKFEIKKLKEEQNLHTY